MLAITFDLGGYTSTLTTTSAAVVFWTIFVVALAVATLAIGGRRRRPGKRTWTYDVPPQATSPRRAAELYRSSSASTRSTIWPDNPR